MSKGDDMDRGPLHGTRVLDLSWLGVGCVATWLLAEMGAEVVKVEPPDGSDNMRNLAPKLPDGVSLAHVTFDRHKRSFPVDLRDPRGQETYRAVARTAHAVVEGFRPGVADRLGIGYERLKEDNAALTYCTMTGFGAGGPLSDVAGHDLNYLARTGMLSLSLPAPAPPALQAADYLGAALAAFGVAAGVVQAQRTGAGIAVESSLFDGGLYSIAFLLAQRLHLGLEPGPGGYFLTGGLACYQTYECADGRYLSVAALEPKFWQHFCDVTGLTEYMDDHHAPERQNEMKKAVADVIVTRTRDEWAEAFEGVDACVAPVLDLGEALAQPHLRARDGLTPTVLPNGRRIDMPAGPLRVRGTTPEPAGVPELGEGVDALLRDAGVREERVAELVSQGIVHVPGIPQTPGS